MIKDIIGKTILFIFIVGFIIGFQSVFGTENSLIGVTTITAMLMLLERDLTVRPINQTLKLIGFNLFIGIAAFLAGLNIWLAIPINFAAMFFLSYSLLYNVRNPLYLPFSLQYLFILVTPVPLSDMPLRLGSLIFGALAIMALQLIVNKNKVSKSGNKLLSELCTTLCKKIESLKQNKNIDDLEETIANAIHNLRNMIFDKREEGFYLGEEARIKLSLSASLEKINLLLNKVPADEWDEEIWEDLHRFLILVSSNLDQSASVDELNDSFSDIFKKYEQHVTDSPQTLSILNHMNFIKVHLTELKQLNKKNKNLVKQFEQIPKKYRKLNIGNNVKHTNSIKLSYAVRMGVGISIAAFISDFFQLSEGRWIIFTILALVIPIYEHSQQKMRDRIFATVVGSILVILLFSIFDGATERVMILMLVGYLNNYIKQYRYSTILITVSAIGSAALVTGTTEVLTLNRIYMVIAGTILAVLINKFVYPYKMEDANRDLTEMYQDIIREMLQEVQDKLKGTGNSYGLKNLFMVTTMVENKMKLNNQELQDNLDTQLFDHQRLLVCTIYELYMWIDKYGVTDMSRSTIEHYLEKIISKDNSQIDLPKLEKHTTDSVNIKDRMVFNMLVEIVKERCIALK
ncbi:FUSC family protein [Bacillus sp. REN10]|uniref:FUSC family protein n=1 Tax=Bacillus sp. REN10 TaxID=2782541 RepID=UPI00193AFE25|nr:FUSC family protein [Bacillus sp. REN10]